MKRKQLYILCAPILAVFLMVLVAGCEKDENGPVHETYNLSASLNGAQEVPANAAAGTGTATGTYNATTNLLSYNVVWAGLTGTASAGHFHSPALAGVNASPLVFFLLQNTGGSGTASGSATLSETQEADLLAGKFYANIHTAANSGGEIRGQVTAVKN